MKTKKRNSRRRKGLFQTRPSDRRAGGLAVRRLMTEQLEERSMLAGDVALPWHNAGMPVDVNADGRATALDAFVVISALRTGGTRKLDAPAGEGESPRRMFYDVNGDNVLSPLDAFRVIGFLRNGEGQQPQVAVTLRATSVNPNNETQTVTLPAGVTGGSFTLTFINKTTAAIPFNATAAQVKSALEALTSVGTNNVSVVSPVAGSYAVTFQNTRGGNDVPLMSINGSALSPTAGGTVTETTKGAQPITSVGTGGTVLVQAYIEDLRSPIPPPSQNTRGVGQAFFDLTYNQNLLQTVSQPSPPNQFDFVINFGPDYNEVDKTGTNIPAQGLIDEVGSSITNFGLDQPGLGSLLVFSVTFQAGATTGPTTFTTAAASGFNQIAFLEPPQNVDPTEIMFGNLTINIVDPVTAINDNFTIAEDNFPSGPPASFNVLANDSVSTPGGVKTIDRISRAPNNGTAVINRGNPADPNDDRIDYTPTANFFGTDSFEYELTDGTPTSARSNATVTVNVFEKNDAPVAGPDSRSVLQGQQLSIPFDQLLLNDTTGPANESNQVLTFVGVGPTGTASTTSAQGGSVVFSSGIITYTPPVGYNGPDSFQYLVRDNGQTRNLSTGLLENDFMTATGTVNIDVQPISDLVAITLQARDLSGAPINSVGLGDTFELYVFVEDLRAPGPNRGVGQAFLDLMYPTAFVSTVAQTPMAPENFDFVITFGSDFDEPANTQGTNVPAQGLIDEVGSIQDNFGQGGTLGSGKFLLFRVQFTADALGTAVFFSSNQADDFGNDVILAEPPQAVPPNQVNFGSTTIRIVQRSPNKPVAVDDSYNATESQTLSVTNPGRTSGNAGTPPTPGVVGVLNNDTDADQPPVFPAGTALSALLVTPPTNAAAFTLNSNGTFTYTPNPGFSGPDTFTYVANDDGNSSNVATVTINVAGINDPPQANNDGYSTSANQTLSRNAALGVLNNDTDPDFNPPNNFIRGTDITVQQTGANLGQTSQGGTLTLRPDGSFDYTPPLNFTGLDTFTYVANDGFVDSNVATVNIQVGITPRVITGFVYFDSNNNGIKEAGERGIANVDILLTGTDLFGNAVNEMTKTRVDGSYRFDMQTDAANPNNKIVLQPSNDNGYTVTQMQPSFVRDGLESLGGIVVPNSNVAGNPANDKFTKLDLKSSAQAVDVNFGEIGLLPTFVSVGDYLASNSGLAVTFAFDGANTNIWVSPGQAGWGQFSSLSARLITPTQLEITGTIGSGATATTHVTVVSTNDSRLRVLGQTASGTVIRINAPATDFKFTPPLP